MGKWFMKRAGIYYRYDNGGWYEYNNGGENTTDQDRQNWAQYYWPLNTTIKVGGVGTGAGVLTNIFWQYWN